MTLLELELEGVDINKLAFFKHLVLTRRNPEWGRKSQRLSELPQGSEPRTTSLTRDVLTDLGPKLRQI